MQDVKIIPNQKCNTKMLTAGGPIGDFQKWIFT